MSKESARAYIERIKTDEDFAAKVREINTPEERMEFVKQAGYEFKAEEIREFQIDDTINTDGCCPLLEPLAKTGFPV